GYGHRRKLFLQAFGVPEAAARFLREESDFYSAGNAAQRDSELRGRRAARFEHHAHNGSLGGSGSWRGAARVLRVVRRAYGVPERGGRPGIRAQGLLAGGFASRW